MKSSLLSVYSIFLFFTNAYSQDRVAKIDSTTRHFIGEKLGGGTVFYIDKLGHHGLIVDTKDVGYTDWDNAKKECQTKGQGWRLPTKVELEILYKKRDFVSGIAYNGYWSSSEEGTSNACVVGMGNWFPEPQEFYVAKSRLFCVRAVRTF